MGLEQTQRLSVLLKSCVVNVTNLLRLRREKKKKVIFVAVQLLDCAQLLVTPWTAAPGFSDHGISQARILEWAAISFSRGSSQPRD